MNKDLLLIIDPQIDFISGSLAVEGAETSMDKLINRIEEVLCLTNNLDFVVSMDWHPSNHCSFLEWPPHCIAYTYGALIYPPLMNTLLSNNCTVHYFQKGCNPDKEEYSFLSPIVDQYGEDATRFIGNKFGSYENIYLAGIAGDYCVLESLKQLKPIHNKIIVLTDCIASIDGGKALSDYCKDNDIKIV